MWEAVYLLLSSLCLERPSLKVRPLGSSSKQMKCFLLNLWQYIFKRRVKSRDQSISTKWFYIAKMYLHPLNSPFLQGTVFVYIQTDRLKENPFYVYKIYIDLDCIISWGDYLSLFVVSGNNSFGEFTTCFIVSGALDRVATYTTFGLWMEEN